METIDAIKGGITGQNSFLITTIIVTKNNPVVYYLNYQQTSPTTPPFYYWEPNLNTISTAGKIPIFTVATTFTNGVSSNVVTFTDSTYNGGLGLEPNGQTIGFALNPGNITVQQNNFAKWLQPYILLAGVDYTLLGANGKIASIPNGSKVQIAANRIQFVPILWYYGCANNSCSVINNSLIVATQWRCNQTPGDAICKQLDPIVNKAWVTIDDANNNFFYDYCPVQNLCGNNACKGPCNQFYYDCDFTSGSESINGFTCTFNSDTFINDDAWWKSPSFIIAMIVIIIVIIIFIFLAIFVLNRIFL